jgi:hypothetical protein
VKIVSCTQGVCLSVQLASRNGFHGVVRLLVERGGADVQERNATTGWVALHEAAFRGHVECVKVTIKCCFLAHLDLKLLHYCCPPPPPSYF